MTSLYSVIESLLQSVVGASSLPSEAVVLVSVVLTIVLTWLIVMYPFRWAMDWLFPKVFKWRKK